MKGDMRGDRFSSMSSEGTIKQRVVADRHAPAIHRKEISMAEWHMKAKYYEACNCAYGCPCNFNGFPTHGNCTGIIAFAVEEGSRAGVNLSGLKMACAVDWPKAIHDGNGKMVVFIDSASDEQRDAIIPILMGEDGGMPWEIIATTISEIHGPFFESIEIEDNGTDSRLRVGEKLVVEMETFKDPVTGDPHEVHTVMPNGFIFTDGLVAGTTTARIDAEGVSFDCSGNNAYYAQVEWSNAGAAQAVA
jgi:hypothetical protein